MSMELPVVWDRMLSTMQRRIGPQEVDIWLRSARPLGMSHNVLTLEVPNPYYSDWIQDNYLADLRASAQSEFGAEVDVRFVAKGEPELPTGDDGADTVGPMVDLPSRSVGLNPGQTFGNFVIGECNRFAHAASLAVTDSPARQYNPLFIYGATGLGKTHLMHAIGNELVSRDPSASVVYVTAEDFMNEMINCLRYKRMEDFRNKYRKRATVLLIDDIQFLSGRDRTQEEFFHTFNALQSSGRQIVMTADVTPREIEKLEPRLRTRFEGGLQADLQAPDKETLLAILWQKADQHGLQLPAELCDAIAHVVAGNVRELEGILNRLAALYSFYHQPLTIEFARERLPDVFAPTPSVVTVAMIIEAVARIHNLRSADLIGGKRTRTLTRPRHIAMYLGRRHTPLSFPELGKEFGDRDHSTIQHGFRKVERELIDDANLAYTVKLIEQNLGVKPTT